MVFSEVFDKGEVYDKSEVFDKGEVSNKDKLKKWGYVLDIGCGCINCFVLIIESVGLIYEGIDVFKDMLVIVMF